MHVNASTFPTPVTPAQPSLNRMSSQPSVLEAARQNRQREQANASAVIPLTAMNFDISVGGNAITVTLSDRASGEVVRKLVYDHGGTLHTSAHAIRGQSIDVAT